MDLHRIIKVLNREQKKELVYLLNRDLKTPQINELKTDINKDRTINCPYCQGSDIYSHGTYKGRKRYKCKTCIKTFNDRTGTTIDGIKKVDKFKEYLVLIIENTSIRKASKKLGVNVKTIFDWRHKLLSYVSVLKE